MAEELRIKRHKDGTRYVRPYLGINAVTGKKIRPYRQFPDSMTDDEVEAEARRWFADIRIGLKFGTAMRLGELLEQYVRWREAEGLAANSVKTYRMIVRNYLGSLARIDPRSVTTAMVNDQYHELLTRGGRGGLPLSAATVRDVHWFLCGGYDWLMQTGICTTNPARAARKPSPVPHEAAALDEQGGAVLMSALAGELAEVPTDDAGVRRRMHAFAAWLALHTGMRCGEACAVRGMDVQVLRGIVRVTGTVVDVPGRLFRQAVTKGHKPRTISIAADEAEAIAAHERWQCEVVGRADRKRTLVSTPGGGLCRPKDVSGTFAEIARSHGIPPEVTFHSLRHTHGTWLLMQGVDPKTVSERLGHADVATTLRIYAHVMPGRDAQAAEEFSRIARGLGGNR